MDDKELSALKALAEAANLNDWPFHGIAFQKAANPAAILSLISRIESADLLAAHYEMLCQSKDARIAELEAKVASRCRAQGGNTCAKCNGSGIESYHDHGASQFGEQAIEPIRCDSCDGFGLATPACDAGGLTEKQREAVREAVQEALARTNAYVCGRTWSAWQFGTMSEDDFQDACTDGDLLDEITETVFSVLATKEAEPLRAVRRLIDGSQPKDIPGAIMVIDSAIAGRSWTYDISPPPGFIDYVKANYTGDVFFNDPEWHALRLWNAAMRNVKAATSPAPSVKQEAKRDFEFLSRLLPEEFMWGDELLAATLSEILDAYDAKIAAPSASHGEVKVPDGFALVPIKATKQMLDAGVKAAREYYELFQGNSPSIIYEAMLAAAPAPSVMDGGVTGFYIEDNCGDTEI